MYYQYLSFSPMNSFFSKVLSAVFILPSFCCMAQIHTDLLPLIPQKSIKDSEFYIQTHSIYKTLSPHLASTWIGINSAEGKCLDKTLTNQRYHFPASFDHMGLSSLFCLQCQAQTDSRRQKDFPHPTSSFPIEYQHTTHLQFCYHQSHMHSVSLSEFF